MMARIQASSVVRRTFTGALILSLFIGCVSSKPGIKATSPGGVKVDATQVRPQSAGQTLSTAKPDKPQVSAPPARAPAGKEIFPARDIPGKIHVVAQPTPQAKTVSPAPKQVPPQPDLPPTLPLQGTQTAETAETAGNQAAVSVDATSSSVYRLRPGDQVSITLRGAHNQVLEDVVNELGEITLVYVGEMPVAGLTSSELERKVRKAYVDGGIFKEIYVTAYIPTRRFTIGGEVKAPGPFPINGKVTLLQAIPMAGGFTEFANKKKIVITRTRTNEQITANYAEIQTKPEKDIEIGPDDMIIVPRDSFGLFSSP